MIKSGENSRTLSFSLSCPPRIPLSSPHPSFLTHTHTHTLCLSISPTHPPIYALKYVMKYDDCWHMGTVCASSACCPSLPHLPHRTLGIGSQSCMNIPGSYVFPPPLFLQWITIFTIGFVNLCVFLRNDAEARGVRRCCCCCCERRQLSTQITQAAPFVVYTV